MNTTIAAMHTPGPGKSHTVKPEITCPSTYGCQLLTLSSQRPMQMTLLSEKQERHQRCDQHVPLWFGSMQRTGSPPLGRRPHQLRPVSLTHVQVLCDTLSCRKIVIFLLSNCFLATELEARDVSRGESLASGHISKLCIWPHNVCAISKQVRVLTFQSTDTQREAAPQRPPGRMKCHLCNIATAVN